jgi:hypothetical protein
MLGCRHPKVLYDAVLNCTAVRFCQSLSHHHPHQQPNNHSVVVDIDTIGTVRVHTFYPINDTTMKTAIALASLLSGAAAFAPASSSSRTPVALEATADLEGLVGVDLESGNKIVRCVVSLAAVAGSVDSLSVYLDRSLRH